MSPRFGGREPRRRGRYRRDAKQLKYCAIVRGSRLRLEHGVGSMASCFSCMGVLDVQGCYGGVKTGSGWPGMGRREFDHVRSTKARESLGPSSKRDIQTSDTAVG